MYTFSNVHNGSLVVDSGFSASRPYHRLVRITKPARGSHHREGQVYVQLANEVQSHEFQRQGI